MENKVKTGCIGRINRHALSCSALTFSLQLKILALVKVVDLVLWPQVFNRTPWAHPSSKIKLSSNILLRGLGVTIVPSSLAYNSGLISSLDLIPWSLWVASPLVGSIFKTPHAYALLRLRPPRAEQDRRWNFKAVFSACFALRCITHQLLICSCSLRALVIGASSLCDRPQSCCRPFFRRTSLHFSCRAELQCSLFAVLHLSAPPTLAVFDMVRMVVLPYDPTSLLHDETMRRSSRHRPLIRPLCYAWWPSSDHVLRMCAAATMTTKCWEWYLH